jgi:hypothetical protein
MAAFAESPSNFLGQLEALPFGAIEILVGLIVTRENLFLRVPL